MNASVDLANDRIASRRNVQPPYDEHELAMLRQLYELVRADSARAVIDPIASRVVAQLSADPTAPLAWEPVPLGVYSDKLPACIRSSWVFVLRGGSRASGAERHPNSHQRVMAYRGSGDIPICIYNQWHSHVLTDDPQAPLLSRWASIPPNTWHQAVVSGPHWVVVSFHTVVGDKLIEERPEPTDTTATLLGVTAIRLWSNNNHARIRD